MKKEIKSDLKFILIASIIGCVIIYFLGVFIYKVYQAMFPHK